MENTKRDYNFKINLVTTGRNVTPIGTTNVFPDLRRNLRRNAKIMRNPIVTQNTRRNVTLLHSRTVHWFQRRITNANVKPLMNRFVI